MLAALAIGLALVGLFGFNTIRNAAMKAAQDAVESQMAAIQPPMVTGPSPAIPPIDPTGLKVEPEKQEL